MTPRLTKATSTLRTWTVTNWPIKLTALVLAAILWAAVAAQEPTEQLVPVQLEVIPPPNRALASELPEVQALFAGRSRALIQLYARPPVVRKALPETVSGSSYTLELSTRDVEIPDGVDVSAREIEPRLIPIRLDDVAEKVVPVIPRVSVIPDSGYAQLGGLTVEPESVLIRGPEARVQRTSSILTRATELGGREPITRTLELDTEPVAGLTLSHSSVAVTVDIGPVAQSVLNGVPVRITTTRTGRWVSDPPAVIVILRGRAERLQRMTADSVQVTARLAGTATEARVRVTVTAPDGVTPTADPAFVWIRRQER